MSKDVDRIKSMFDGLDNASRDEIIAYLNGRRKRYNKNYSEIISKVKAHLLSKGSITAQEAHKLGFTEKELHTTTFKRCVINKIDLDLVTKRLSNRRNCYILKGMESTTNLFDSIDNRLVSDIIDRVDFSLNVIRLRPLLDSERYPVLKNGGSLAELAPRLIGAMESKGYYTVSSRLEFAKGEE